jgi:hypothetical protein
MDNMSTFIGTSIPNMVNNQVKAPQRTLTGAIDPNTYYATKEMDYITENPMHIKIHRVANGFVVQTVVREGDRHTAHIATTIEEVHEIITTQLVTKKMEGK